LDPDRPQEGLVRDLPPYGPLDPLFDKTWQPGEIEQVK
jgi:hypothetical protein